MAEGVLRVRPAGGPETRAEVDALVAAVTAAQQRIGRVRRTSQRSVQRDAKEQVDQVVAEEKRGGAAVVAEVQRVTARRRSSTRQATGEAVSQEQLVTRAKLRELALQGQAQQQFVALYRAAHAQATAAFMAETGKRGALSEREKRQIETVALAIVNEHQRAERRRTADTQRESDKRVAKAQREADAVQRANERAADASRRAWASTGAQAGTAVAGHTIQAVSMAHGQIQNAREVVGDRTSALNTALGQRGTAMEENAADNARIQARLAAAPTGVEPAVALDAIAKAQSFAGALNGDNANRRRDAINATLNDVEFAGSIDPQNVAGIVNIGALLRNRVQDPAMRERILRGAVGTSFEGSVETDAMITSALPGLLEAISTGTADARTDTERDRLTAEIAQDFFAQIQSQAAGGRTTGVSAHRTNTVRRALGNDPRQERLGLALAEVARTGTPEQRAAFEAAFTKDRATGTYSMNEAVRSTPSNAARFLGTMFNNDNEALHNFMGVHGGGGARQLMNTPDVDAIGSYFGMTRNRAGQSVREYDHVEELKTATVTDAQAQELRRMRAGETRTQLIQERERALANWNPANQGLTGRASNRARTIMTENPILSMLGLSTAGTALTTGGGALGRSAFGGLRAAVGGGGLAGLLLGLGAAGTGLGLYGSTSTAATGLDAAGNQVSTGERVARGAAAAASSIFSFGPVISAIKDLPRDLATAMRAAGVGVGGPTSSPNDGSHRDLEGAGSRGGAGGNNEL